MSEESPIYNFDQEARELKTKLEEGLRYFIGVKQIQAKPMSRHEFADLWASEERYAGPDAPGYMVVYPGGHHSWSPKEVFESAYFPMGDDPTRIDMAMVENMIQDAVSIKVHNQQVQIHFLRSGFTIVTSDACVDPANFDPAIGSESTLTQAIDEVWRYLGFVLAWARNGIEPKPVDSAAIPVAYIGEPAGDKFIQEARRQARDDLRGVEERMRDRAAPGGPGEDSNKRH